MANAPERLRILIVDDDEADRILIRRGLEQTGATLTFSEADCARAGFDAMARDGFDCVILDFELPDMHGLGFLRTMSEMGWSLPVIVITGNPNTQATLLAVRHGAQDFLYKADADGRTLLRSIRLAIERHSSRRRLDEDTAVLRRENLQLADQATTDELTGVANRRALRKRISEGLASGTALAIVDIDHFKAFNDTLGHAEGDRALVSVARTIGGCLGESEFLARFGGDEFVVLLRGADRERAQLAGERFRRAVERMLGLGRKITVSVGICLFGRETNTPDALFRGADAALLHAKKAGRNCVVVWTT